MNNHGFFTLYGLFVMQIIISFISMLTFRMVFNASFLKNDATLSYVELFAVHKAKLDLLEYEEQEEERSYLNYEIEFFYDDITCYITIKKEGVVELKSCLEWDDIDNVVLNYTYLP